MAGWICSYRKVWDNPIFKGNAQRVGVWDWMLKTAAWKDTEQVAGASIITVRRGQLCVSQSQITEATGMPRQALRTFLNLLEKTNTIRTEPATKATKGRTLITICNYDELQAPVTASQPNANQTPTKRQPTKEQGNKGTITTPYGVDGNAVDFTKEVFDRGVAFLGRYGTPEPKARALIGKWRKDSSDTETFNALRDASREGVTEPVAWITARLKPKPAAFTPSFDLSKFEDQA